MDDQQRHDRGLEVRQAVLGSTHVDRSLQNRIAFTEEFQDLITRYAWSEIWTRSSLSRQSRSCMTLSMMLALGHWDEFNLHVRAALNNGLGHDEIKELLLQAAIYCGVPAANHGFKLAHEVFAEKGEQQ
jgi:4-carboxymuconolactone decarboxylase